MDTVTNGFAAVKKVQTLHEKMSEVKNCISKAEDRGLCSKQLLDFLLLLLLQDRMCEKGYHVQENWNHMRFGRLGNGTAID